MLIDLIRIPMSDWCTIESDPAVFTELISSFGVSDCEVEEVYSMDQVIECSHGLVFLFKWVSEIDNRPVLNAEVFTTTVITKITVSFILYHMYM